MQALRGALPRPLRAVLPALEPFLAENVAKEIRKDALVIAQAEEGLRAGTADGPERVLALLAAARDIDQEFLARVGRLAARIRIPYARIEPVRRRRIEAGLRTARRILEAWGRGSRLRAAFAPGELEQALFEMLRLYAEETEALSHALELPALLAPLRGLVVESLRDAMLQAASSLLGAAPAATQNG